MTDRWTIEQYRAHIYARKQPAAKKGAGDKQKGEIEMILKLLGLEYVKEHKFSEERKFRFDWAIPAMKVAIEYEGLFSEKSGHTTVKGFVKDTEKYNLAALEGWTVLRYTVKNYKKVTGDLRKILNQKQQ